MWFKKEFSANILGRETWLCGHIITDQPIRLEGIQEGTIQTADKLIIGTHGFLNGKAIGKIVDVAGRIEGEIEASELVILRASSIVYGTLRTPCLVVEKGARIKGDVKMSDLTTKTGTKRLQPEKREAPISDYEEKHVMELWNSAV